VGEAAPNAFVHRTLKQFETHETVGKAVFLSSNLGLLVTQRDEHEYCFWDTGGGGLRAVFHHVADGFLWSTLPDEASQSGWFWTNRRELIHVIECDEDGSNPRALPAEDPKLPEEHEQQKAFRRRDNYVEAHNREDIVMARINDPPRYRALLAELAGRRRLTQYEQSDGKFLTHSPRSEG